MRILKTILKSMALLLVGAVALTSCKKDIDINGDAYLVFGNTSVQRSVAAEYKIGDFTSYKLSGVNEDVVVAEGEEKPSYALGTWNTYDAMRAAYVAIPSYGTWTLTLEASKGETIFRSSVQKYITSGPNSVAFSLEPAAYGKDGSGSVKVGVLIENLPYEVTVTYDEITLEYGYSIDVLGYEVTTTCATEAALAKTLSLDLQPEYNADESVISNVDRFGVVPGTYTYTGKFLATLEVTDIPSDDYRVVFHLNKGSLKDIKKQSVLITVTDGMCAESKAEVGYDYNDAETGIAAVLNACEYNITYVMNEGSFAAEYTAPASYSSLNDNDIILPGADDIKRFGYTFLGWYTTSTFDEGTEITVIKGNGVDGGDKTLYAKWELTNFTITYHFGNGSYYYEYPTSYTVLTPNVTLPVPVPNVFGYEFKGWFTSENFESDTEVKDFGANTIAEDLELYAKYGLLSYDIVYETNGGNLPEGYVSEFYATSSRIDLPTPTKAGYRFIGWYTTATFGNGNEISYIEAGSANDVYVYAKWEIIDYTITYYGYSGAAPLGPVSYNVESSDITLPVPVQSGYDFVGWYTTGTYDDGTEISAIVSGSRTGDLIVYAKWAACQYTITYNVNAGTMPASYVTDFSGVVEVELPIPTRSNYNFAGWYTTSTFDEGTDISSIAAGTNSDVEVWAKWDYVPPAEWQISSYGSYGFTQNGNKWTSNNQGKDSTTASTTWTITLAQTVTVSIVWSVSSESNYDVFNMYFDDGSLEFTENTNNGKGKTGVTSGIVTKTLTAGTHTLTATYAKDGSSANGDDCGTLTLNPVYYN